MGQMKLFQCLNRQVLHLNTETSLFSTVGGTVSMPQSAGTAFELNSCEGNLPSPRFQCLNRQVLHLNLLSAAINGANETVSMPQSAGTAFEHQVASGRTFTVSGFNASIGRYCI
jgi:hypothetical protein